MFGPHSITLRGKRNSAGVIKVTDQLTLREEIILDYLGGPVKSPTSFNAEAEEFREI